MSSSPTNGASMPAVEDGDGPEVAPVACIEKRRHCGLASPSNGRETGTLSLPEHRDTLLASIAAKHGGRGCEERVAAGCAAKRKSLSSEAGNFWFFFSFFFSFSFFLGFAAYRERAGQDLARWRRGLA